MKTKNFFKYFFILFAVATVSLTSCKDDDDDKPEPVNYFQEMKNYMEGNSLDLSDVISESEWIITAADVNTNGTDNYYIIDLRSDTDFDAAHIDGAHNTTLANVLTEAENADKPILLVCYTGQTAAHAHTALRLSGYSDCKVMMFGMSAWNSSLDKWTANTSSFAIGDDNWSEINETEAPVTFSYPTFTATAETGEEILEERVQYMLDEGFKGVNSTDVLAAPTDYFINNYWASTDVDQYGHIVSAYRIKEDLTLVAGGFENLDAASTVVTYCWTGQTSSLVTAYLTVLGYDALSLNFGANGMIYDNLLGHNWDNLLGHNWSVDAANDFPVVATK
jgi:rhodanese-related sulfurtransferase